MLALCSLRAAPNIKELESWDVANLSKKEKKLSGLKQVLSQIPATVACPFAVLSVKRDRASASNFSFLLQND